MSDPDQLRMLFVNENIGGNATMHLHIRRALADMDDVSAQFIDAAPRGPLRRMAGVAVPGLARLDLDLAPLRGQLALSAHVRRRLDGVTAPFDVLHAYTHNAALLSVDYLRRRPSIVGLDATTAQSIRLLPYREPTRFTERAVAPARRLEQRVYDAAGRIVAKSDWARRSLLEDYDVDPSRVSLIPYGITVPDPPEVDRRDDVVVFVGRSMARKGGWLLLDAWRQALRPDIRLVLVTPEAVPTEPGLEVIPDIRPGDPRLVELLAAASVLAYPTTADTFGYAALEAMAVGTPVVAADATAIPEIVIDGETGRLVPPGDREALAAALAALLGDPTKRRDFGVASRQRVLDHFDARVTTRQLVDLASKMAQR